MHIKNGVSSDTLASLQLAGNISEETLKKNVARFNKKIKDFKAKNKIFYSERSGNAVSNRTLLANAFEGLSQNSDEYAMIQRYRNRIRLLEEQDEFVFPDVHKILRNNITSNNITKNVSLATPLMWQGNFTFYLVT